MLQLQHLRHIVSTRGRLQLAARIHIHDQQSCPGVP